MTARMSRRGTSRSMMSNSCTSMSSSNALCLSGLSFVIVAMTPSISSRTVPAIGAPTYSLAHDECDWNGCWGNGHRSQPTQPDQDDSGRSRRVPAGASFDDDVDDLGRRLHPLGCDVVRLPRRRDC